MGVVRVCFPRTQEQIHCQCLCSTLPSTGRFHWTYRDLLAALPGAPISEPLGDPRHWDRRRMTERREGPHHLIYPLLPGSQSCVLHTICCTDDEITFSHLTSLSFHVSASCIQEGFELWSLSCSQNHCPSQYFTAGQHLKSLFPPSAAPALPGGRSVPPGSYPVAAGQVRSCQAPQKLLLLGVPCGMKEDVRSTARPWPALCGFRRSPPAWLGHYCFHWVIEVTGVQGGGGLAWRLWVHPEHLPALCA